MGNHELPHLGFGIAHQIGQAHLCRPRPGLPPMLSVVADKLAQVVPSEKVT
jgi:hypothetical protein